MFDESVSLSIEIVKLYRTLVGQRKEYVLSKQLLRSGTSIGANIAEALEAISTKEFIMKMNISLKESVETLYWFEVLTKT